MEFFKSHKTYDFMKWPRSVFSIRTTRALTDIIATVLHQRPGEIHPRRERD